MTDRIILPARGRGRQSAAAVAAFKERAAAFCAAILEIQSRLDFKVSSRGWCYLLEEHGLGKGDFDRAQAFINDCRKAGLLPLDICAEDGSRETLHVDTATARRNALTIEDAIEAELSTIESAREDAIRSAGWGYAPYGFWHDQDHYIEMMVEKIDLRELFAPICREFHIALTNSRGWPDINSRAAMMRRFAKMEHAGKQCVLLYCGDHDPAGLAISTSLRAMLADLTQAVGWSPTDLIIDRFGLNADFIVANNLTWIDGLETGSGENLADKDHGHHLKSYVQSYLQQFGARKVEANALVARPGAGRDLCRRAVAKYISEDARKNYEITVEVAQQEIKAGVRARLA
jgi:hypothetical protein